jgi:hypothetical protein
VILVSGSARSEESFALIFARFTHFLRYDSNHFVIPEKAVDCGFRKGSDGFDMNFSFTLKSGPVVANANMTPLEAIEALITPELIDYFCIQATAVTAEKSSEDDISPVRFWGYFYGVIALGLVQYAEEGHAFSGISASCNGLFGNSAMKSLFTKESWQHAKQLWTAPREELTRDFNEISKRLMVPTRFVSIR